VYSFSAEYGVQHLAKKIDLLSGKEFGAYVNDISTGTYNNLDALPNTDWQDQIFRNAPMGNYQFSMSGASEKQQYYLGIGIFNQQGIIEKSDFNRLTVKMNNTYKLSKSVRIGNNLTIAPYQQSNAPNVTYAAYRAQPVIKPFNPDGTYAEVPGVGNPLADIAYTNNSSRGVRSVGNMFGEVDILKNLTFRSSFGIDFNYAESRAFTPVFYVSPQQLNERNDLNIGNFRNSNWLWENTLNYSFDRGEQHHFDMVAGYTMQQLRSRIFTVAGENIISEEENLWYINGNNINPNSVFNGVDPNQNYSLLSYLFRANYTYKNRYLFTATFRRDGSSKFIARNRWGNFPSFAAGWNIAEEAFMDRFKAINTLKLRASWGQIGNEKISYLDQYALIINGANAIFGTSEAYRYRALLSVKTAIRRSAGKPPPKPTWDLKSVSSKAKSRQNSIITTARPTISSLNCPRRATPATVRACKVRYNAASVLNQGLEFNVVYRRSRRRTQVPHWRAGLHGQQQSAERGRQQRVDSTLVGGFLGNGQSVTLSKEGLPIGAYYGYQVIGVFQNQAQLDATPHKSIAGVGDLIYADLNGDGKINTFDRTYIGSAIPKFIYGFNTEFNYKKLDLSIDFQGQPRKQTLQRKRGCTPRPVQLRVAHPESLDRRGNQQHRAACYYRRLQLGYLQPFRSGWILPAPALGNTGLHIARKRFYAQKMQSARVYLRGTNVWTLTKFTGYTPKSAVRMYCLPVLITGLSHFCYLQRRREHHLLKSGTQDHETDIQDNICLHPAEPECLPGFSGGKTTGQPDAGVVPAHGSRRHAGHQRLL
jgi:TonB-linked SusC/RagA family outer membrane protein